MPLVVYSLDRRAAPGVAPEARSKKLPRPANRPKFKPPVQVHLKEDRRVRRIRLNSTSSYNSRPSYQAARLQILRGWQWQPTWWIEPEFFVGEQPIKTEPDQPIKTEPDQPIKTEPADQH